MRSARILVVEDEALIAMELEDRLSRLGYEVCGRAASGEEALELAEAHKPDLAIVDIRLSGARDGIEVASAIRRRLEVAIMFVSAFNDRAVRERAAAIGARGFLAKPFDEAELRACVTGALGSDGTQKRPERR